MPKFLVDIDYQTPNDNAGTWRGEVEATDEWDALRQGDKIVKRKRRVMKIDGGSCEEID